jgi:PAS domain S-box-containing protein
MDRAGGRIVLISAGAAAAACTAGGAAVWLLRDAPDDALAAAIVIVALGVLVTLFALAVQMLSSELKRRAKAERAEDESETLYRLLAAHSSDMIVLINLTDRTRRYVSPSCRRLFGYEPDELTGQSIDSMIHPDDLPLLRAAEEELKRSGRAIITARNQRKDGRYIWAETSWEKIVNSRSGQIELVAVARDVTERVEAQQALGAAIEEAKAARIRADAANRAKSQFLANMSHEIRTPINGIMGMSHLLAETPLSEEQRGYAQTIAASGSSLLAIINDILDLAKLEAGRVALESASFAPSALVESVVAMLSPLAREKGIELSASVEPALRGPYLCDPTRLRQALVNLVANAVKFTEQGNVRVEASSIEASGDRTTLRFAVSDTGIGIATEALPRIFQKFGQADASVTRKYGGTGLGLAITKQLVELMGGSIAVSSREGVGSRFWFDLSLARAATAARGEPGPIAARWQAADRKLRVLLVEDNAVNQRVAQLILEKAGHDVDTVDSGRKAIEAVKSSVYDVILMDIQMADIDGVEATKRIRALPPPTSEVPIIALTASALAGAREQFLSVGMNDYIAKPFRPADLLAALDRAAAGGAAGGDDGSAREDRF